LVEFDSSDGGAPDIVVVLSNRLFANDDDPILEFDDARLTGRIGGTAAKSSPFLFGISTASTALISLDDEFDFLLVSVLGEDMKPMLYLSSDGILIWTCCC
jgi:hypothetical protein